MFYLKLADLNVRSAFIESMKAEGVWTVFHYVPLHTSSFGKSASRFQGEDLYTTRESERLVRLPIWYGMTDDEQAKIISAVKKTLAAM